MMAYIIEIPKPKFSNIQFREFDQSETGQSQARARLLD